MNKEKVTFDSLIGKTVNRLLMSPGADKLIFQTDQGDFLYTTGAMCCSETFIYHITAVDFLLGQKVEEVIIKKDWHEVSDSTRQQSDLMLLATLKTTRGLVDIEVRNSSSGCYSGNITLDDINDLPRREEMENRRFEWKEIRADF